MKRHRYTWAVVILAGIFFLWPQLELLLYGEVQPREVDTYITFAWEAAMVYSYIRGYSDGFEDREIG